LPHDMPSRETFRIGSVEIPKITFPYNMDSILNGYMAANDADYRYVAIYGIERPQLLDDSTIDLKLFKVYAALKLIEVEPNNGLAILELVDGLADMNDADGVKLVLQSLEQSDGIHLYPVWDEDPMFQLGWFMADFQRYEEAIEAYRKCVLKPFASGKWVVWIHLGSVYHELGDFQEANECYQHALESIEVEPDPQYFDTARQTEVINRLAEQTFRREPYAGERIKYGIELKPEDNN